MSDNTVLILTVLLNVLKDIFVVGLFGFFAYYVNNIWIILLALLFVGGYHVKINNNERKEKKDE